jgi:hypothetical protein
MATVKGNCRPLRSKRHWSPEEFKKPDSNRAIENPTSNSQKDCDPDHSLFWMLLVAKLTLVPLSTCNHQKLPPCPNDMSLVCILDCNRTTSTTLTVSAHEATTLRFLATLLPEEFFKSYGR